MKRRKEIASGLSLPLKQEWWGCSFRSSVSYFSAFGSCRSTKPIPGACNTSRASRPRRYPDRGQRRLAVVPGASLGLRQARGSAQPEARGRAPRHHAAAVPDVLQADRQSQRHGYRQPCAPVAGRLRGACGARPFLDAAARRPPRVVRPGGGRRRAALVAARHRRGRRAGARSITGRSTPASGAGDRSALRRVGTQTSRRLYRHAQSRNHRRHHHRGRICALPISGPISTESAGSMRWCGFTNRHLGFRR